MKYIIICIILGFCVSCYADSKTIRYGLNNKSYSTSFLGKRPSGISKINSVPYGNGYINRSYDRSGRIIRTTVTVPYGSNGWLTR